MNKIFFDTLVKIICIFLFIVSCSKGSPNQKEILALQENSNISDEEALYGIGRIIFRDTLKSFKAEKNSSEKQDVTIEYGGNRAYTFYTEGNYSERIQFDTVRLILLYANAAKKRNLDNMRISVVKPYYVKEPDVKKEVTEEFEVFRASISVSDLEKISGWNNQKLLNDNRNVNNPNVIETFNQVRLRWKIELNELSRIELK
ncbi:MAG TPA: hypothetical protein PLX69_01755 [Leptospiraceae bacterium]|nr:hypothetical protein [Leptospiraceae bacterium]HRG73262.1 hypothetical protein [Leptospiraceae bacterium]